MEGIVVHLISDGGKRYKRYPLQFPVSQEFLFLFHSGNVTKRKKITAIYSTQTFVAFNSEASIPLDQKLEQLN